MRPTDQVMLADHVNNLLMIAYPRTPDGRYFVVRGRLWRLANPALSDDDRIRFTKELMTARRSVASAKRLNDDEAVISARKAVDKAKRDLGERGPVWWSDGAPDHNRKMAINSPYAEWYRTVAKKVETSASELAQVCKKS